MKTAIFITKDKYRSYIKYGYTKQKENNGPTEEK